MSRTFVLEPPRAGPRGNIDLTEARRFGEIIYLFEPGDHRAGIFEDMFSDDVLNALDDHGYDPDKDYFVFAGGLVPMCRIASVLTGRYGRFRALLFCTSTRNYVDIMMGDTTYARISDRTIPHSP